MTNFNTLYEMNSAGAFSFADLGARMVIAPDLGGRVFCELDRISLHRLDIDAVMSPSAVDFNNYGGNNLWPAPEGGRFGFNYDGDRWRVQDTINLGAFTLEKKDDQGATAVKSAKLVNRAGTNVDIVMRRILTLSAPSALLTSVNPKTVFAYCVDDSMEVRGEVSNEDALIACWSLEQFPAGGGTVAFARVDEPQKALNIDYYEDPAGRITFGKRGLVYKTDGLSTGQIGIKAEAGADLIGFVDYDKKIAAVKRIVEPSPGTYFNIADNDQPNGSYSAADSYSIYNSDPEGGFFEIETIGAAQIKDGRLTGSRLVSETTFAVFEDSGALDKIIASIMD